MIHLDNAHACTVACHQAPHLTRRQKHILATIELGLRHHKAKTVAVRADFSGEFEANFGSRLGLGRSDSDGRQFRQKCLNDRWRHGCSRLVFGGTAGFDSFSLRSGFRYALLRLTVARGRDHDTLGCWSCRRRHRLDRRRHLWQASRTRSSRHQAATTIQNSLACPHQFQHAFFERHLIRQFLQVEESDQIIQR